MSVGVIGASAAGLYTALLYSRLHPRAEVAVYDRADKVGKKLLATGNGHCNLMHVPFEPTAFNHPSFIKTLLQKCPQDKMMKTLGELGIATLAKGELIYPLSYSASSHVRYLFELCLKEGIVFRLNETVTDVDGGTIYTASGKESYERIVFAFGGKSQANLGSDGSMFAILSKIGYPITPLVPSLCPLRSADVPKSLFGVRHHALVRLVLQEKILYEEDGELQFKRDGLSGIAIMNASSRYEKGAKVVVDLFPEMKEEELLHLLEASYSRLPESFLSPIVEKPLADFLLKYSNTAGKKAMNFKDIARLAKNMKTLEFSIDGRYDFDSSQVTRGGVALSEVTDLLQSKRDPRHFFVGECLDIDGLCGGYNLGFALLSSIIVGESL